MSAVVGVPLCMFVVGLLAFIVLAKFGPEWDDSPAGCAWWVMLAGLALLVLVGVVWYVAAVWRLVS